MLLSSVCITLLVLAFCQVLVDAVLPEGAMRRYVAFLMGAITVLVVLGLFVNPQVNLQTALREGFAPAPRAQAQSLPGNMTNPYEQFLRKLIEDHRE